MLDTIDTINTLLLDAAAQPWVPLVLLLFCAIDSIFPPVPSESLLVGLAAIAAASGEPQLWLVLLAGAGGAVIGDLTAYLLGRRVGTRRFAWMRRPKVAEAIDRAGRALHRRSARFIIAGRFVPVVRVAINLTAGASAMSVRRFLPLSVTAGTIWASFSVGVGMLGGRWVQDNPLLGMASAIALALVLGTVVDRLVQRFTTEPAVEAYAEPRDRVVSR